MALWYSIGVGIGFGLGLGLGLGFRGHGLRRAWAWVDIDTGGWCSGWEFPVWVCDPLTLLDFLAWILLDNWLAGSYGRCTGAEFNLEITGLGLTDFRVYCISLVILLVSCFTLLESRYFLCHEQSHSLIFSFTCGFFFPVSYED